MAKKKKPQGIPHTHKWFLVKYENGLYHYKCFCGHVITTEKPIR